MVANVPEIGLEAQVLLGVLDRSGSLSVVERGNVADAALRLALSHGKTQDATCERLAYSALSILVNSFHTVIGVVGVPANFIYDKEGKDTSQLCRKSMLRMMMTIKDYKNDLSCTVANDIRAALSQLAVLCKSDLNLNGLNSVAVQKRKIVLKELWEHIVKLNCILGGGVQL